MTSSWKSVGTIQRSVLPNKGPEAGRVCAGRRPRASGSVRSTSLVTLVCNAAPVPELAGRLYIPKLYSLDPDRASVVELLEDSVRASGARVVYSSFRDERVAPIYIGAEEGSGARYGLLIYPFRATRRVTPGRPADEHRAQIRLGDPVRERKESNPVARDVAGVDVTLVLTVDPETELIVGLDPLVYADLPMGISVYYRDRHLQLTQEHGWAVWERDKSRGARRSRLVEVETLVGFRPHRLLDYVRFEAKASALGLNPGLRGALAREFTSSATGPHRLESFFGLGSKEILDIIESNFRLGVAVRGGVAERHLEAALRQDPAVSEVTPIDADGQPDLKVLAVAGDRILVECKTVSRDRYKDGSFKVEVQKTRDSGAGRQYRFDQFDVLAACLFPATGLWEYRFIRTRDLEPLATDQDRIKPMQRIHQAWARSLSELLTGR